MQGFLSAKVYPCFLERPLLFVLLLALFMVRIIFSCRSCRDGQYLSFNEERYQRRSKRISPSWNSHCCHGAPLVQATLLPSLDFASGKIRRSARLRRFASDRYAPLLDSAKRRRFGTVYCVRERSALLCCSAARYGVAHRFPTVGAARFSK